MLSPLSSFETNSHPPRIALGRSAERRGIQAEVWPQAKKTVLACKVVAVISQVRLAKREVQRICCASAHLLSATIVAAAVRDVAGQVLFEDPVTGAETAIWQQKMCLPTASLRFVFNS